MYQPHNFPPQIHIESQSNVTFCLVSYLKSYLHYTGPFRKKLDGSLMYSLFWGNNRQDITICAKMITSWVR